jgi:uncharacterized protein YndB with AHSA1/START domain
MMHTFSTQREIAAPVATLYHAISTPDLFALWWGPDGFSNTFDLFEFYPGGRWVFTMHGPDGRHYPNECVFVDIDPLKQLVIRHSCAPLFTLTIRLSATASGTLVQWAQQFDDAELAQKLAAIVEPANEQNLSRLAAVVASNNGN